MPEAVPDFDLYLELEVHPSASTETINAAYRSLAKRAHPDLAADQAAAAQRMFRLNIARDWLVDRERRGAYDATRRTTTALYGLDGEHSDPVDDGAEAQTDSLLPAAVAVIDEYDRASASLLQRRLGIGYTRAARIIDQLEHRGYVGAFDGSNARVVLRRNDISTPSDSNDPAESNAEGSDPAPTAVYRCGACEDHGRPARLTAFPITTNPGAISTHWCGAKVVWTGEPPKYMRTLADPDDWQGYLALALWFAPPILALLGVGPVAALVTLAVTTALLLFIRWVRRG